MTNRERYASTGTWTKILRSEGFNVYESVIRNRMKAAGVIGCGARARSGRVVREGFYAESDVRRVCADLLVAYLKVNEHGYIESDGDKYCTIYFLKRHFGVSEYLIRSVCKDLDSIKGRDEHNVERDFYPLSVVDAAIQKLNAYPRVDDDGFVLHEGVRLGSLGFWRKTFGMETDVRTIRILLDRLGVAGLTAIDRSGKISDSYLYSEADFLRATDAHRTEVRLDDSNTVQVQGNLYITAAEFCSQHGLSDITARKKLNSSDITFIEARGKRGKSVRVYPEEQLRVCFSDLMKDGLRIGEDGFVNSKSDRYATIQTWTVALGIRMDFRTARIQLKKLGISGVDGFAASGRLLKGALYKEEDVLRLKQSGMGQLPVADEKGYITIDGECYGTLGTLASFLGVTWKRISGLVRARKPESLDGRTPQGTRAKFYSLSVIRGYLPDDLSKMPQAGEKGTFEFDGRVYATPSTLVGLLGVSGSAIDLRIRKHALQAIKGKARTGRVCDFYPVEELRRLCADLIAKKSDDQ